ncbi:MAG: PilW family protein [Betaproteobacteria bacterium]
MRTLNRGYTLIELMVAMAISTLALISLTELYSSTRLSYRLQSMQSRLSEDGRFAVSMLQRLVSQAGYHSSSNVMTSSITATNSTSMNIGFTGDGANTMTCDGSLANGVKNVTISSSETTLRCMDSSLTDPTHNWIGASTGGNGTELADFRIGYGEDISATHAGTGAVNAAYSCGATHKDCVADKYTYGNTSESVVSVKLCFILRSEASDSSVKRTAKYKNCTGEDIEDSFTDHKLYRTFNTTVLLKNRQG